MEYTYLLITIRQVLFRSAIKGLTDSSVKLSGITRQILPGWILVIFHRFWVYLCIFRLL